MNYDYLIVGAGFFGATVAERLASRGKKVLIIDVLTLLVTPILIPIKKLVLRFISMVLIFFIRKVMKSGIILQNLLILIATSILFRLGIMVNSIRCLLI